MLGTFLQWAINLWIKITGKRVVLEQKPWLKGPVAQEKVVGTEFYKNYAEQKNLKAVLSEKGGLLPDFSAVIGENDPNRDKLNPRISHFYENTAGYKLEVWSQWYAPISWFAKILIKSVSTRMNQLNIPLSPLETSHGMSSEVIELIDEETGIQKYACWLRKSSKSDRVVYAGFYTNCRVANAPQDSVKVVFPLPQGSVTVLLKVEVQPDGSVKLISHGSKLEGTGYFRIRKTSENTAHIRRIPLKEIIHVFEDPEGQLRTDHTFYFWGIKFLHLHYKIVAYRIRK